jgi:hypothetical protein
MPLWFTDDEMSVLEAVVDLMIPTGDSPGALESGAADYIDGFLGAFLVEPPRIWAGGPTSGRHGGISGFTRFHDLSRLDELCWRTRVEGSKGIPEREFNGPVRGLQEVYRKGLAGLGEDFCAIDADEREARLRSPENAEFTALVFQHVCEGTFGAPEYGGNRDQAGWRSIGFTGDVQPRGWTDEEVSEP